MSQFATKVSGQEKKPDFAARWKKKLGNLWIVKILQQKKENIHTALDVAGLAPVPGADAADVLNTILYAGEGDFSNALLSGISAIPIAGYATKLKFVKNFLAKRAKKIAKADVLKNAKYAQKNYSEKFSKKGKFAGRAINDVADDLRSGRLTPDDVPIDYIQRGDSTLIQNTRSAQALERAGIPRKNWKTVNRTGNLEYEERLNKQLKESGLTEEGLETVRSREAIKAEKKNRLFEKSDTARPDRTP